MGKRVLISTQVHVADGKAKVQGLALGEAADSFFQGVGRGEEVPVFLSCHAQPQVGPMVVPILQCLEEEAFGHLILFLDGRDIGVVALAEGHAQPGEEIGVEGVEVLAIHQVDGVHVIRELFVKCFPKAFAKGQDQLSGQPGIGFKVEDVFNPLEPDVI